MEYNQKKGNRKYKIMEKIEQTWHSLKLLKYFSCFCARKDETKKGKGYRIYVKCWYRCF